MNYQPEYYEKNLVSIYVLQQMLFLMVISYIEKMEKV